MKQKAQSTKLSNNSKINKKKKNQKNKSSSGFIIIALRREGVCVCDCDGLNLFFKLHSLNTLKNYCKNKHIYYEHILKYTKGATSILVRVYELIYLSFIFISADLLFCFDRIDLRN